MGTKGKTKSDALVRAFVNELGAFKVGPRSLPWQDHRVRMPRTSDQSPWGQCPSLRPGSASSREQSLRGNQGGGFGR